MKNAKAKKESCCCSGISVKKAACTLGLLLAILHAICVGAVVATNGELMAKWFVLHFTVVPFTILSFDPVNFVIGTVVAGLTGAFIGGLFALLWNACKGGCCHE
ncbi:hypothetical protein HY992_03595 [Candidatus Micrarchaeota archaeon]|nr:hypothetical protein [Candidatus Micrarchaeota archaeon]